MVIRVRLFGPEAAAVEASTVDVRVDEPATCENLLAELKRMHPQLNGRIAVNHAFARPDDCIGQDDEVALIGLVSGG